MSRRGSPTRSRWWTRTSARRPPGLTAVARNAAAAVAPALAGVTLAVPALGLPFLVAGGLKIAYDLAILALFRGVRPPEESARGTPELSASPPS